MAVYFQGYNPWREQLAGSILAPLLKAALERGQQADMNRKENAFIDEAMKQFQPPVDTSMPSMLQGFDTDFGAQAMQPQVRNIQDIQARLAELQASDRFNMLNPDRTRQLMAPMMDQYAAAENARRMQDFFNQFASKQDPFERFVHMARGAGMKYMPDRAVGDFVDLYKHQTPHQTLAQVDTGDRALGYAWNPATGSAREVFAHEIKMNPYQAEDLANDRMRIGISAGQLGLAREKFNYEREHGGQDGNYQFLQAPDGSFIRANRRTGDLTPTDIVGAQRGGTSASKMDERDKVQYKDALDRRRSALAAYLNMPTPEGRAYLDQIEGEIAEYEARLYGGPSSQPASDGKVLTQAQVDWLTQNGQTVDSLRKKGYIVP